MLRPAAPRALSAPPSGNCPRLCVADHVGSAWHMPSPAERARSSATPAARGTIALMPSCRRGARGASIRSMRPRFGSMVRSPAPSAGLSWSRGSPCACMMHNPASSPDGGFVQAALVTSNSSHPRPFAVASVVAAVRSSWRSRNWPTRAWPSSAVRFARSGRARPWNWCMCGGARIVRSSTRPIGTPLRIGTMSNVVTKNDLTGCRGEIEDGSLAVWSKQDRR